MGTQRATSVGPRGNGGFSYDDDISMRLPLPAPSRNANRASSVAPTMGRGDFYGDVNGGSIAERLNPNEGLKRRNTYHNTNGANHQRREFASPVSVYLNTEVNARYPAAVDRHIRVVQWNHWTRDKCRFAKPASTCIMTMWHMSVSTACISADPFTHHIRD